MEFLYEAIVMFYLARGNRFCCPQFSIKADSGKGDWRSLDFVVLDFDTPQVIVAEVTPAGDMGPFAAKAKELYDQGAERIRKELADRAKATIPDIAKWPIKFHLFVRQDRGVDLRKNIEGYKFDVYTLEQAFPRWKWPPLA